MGEVVSLTRSQILAGHSRRVGLRRLWLEVDDATYRALCEIAEDESPTEMLMASIVHSVAEHREQKRSDLMPTTHGGAK